MLFRDYILESKSLKVYKIIQKEVYSHLGNCDVAGIRNDVKFYTNTKNGVNNSFEASRKYVEESGQFPIYGKKARDFCKKIYGKDVDKWSLNKQIETYNSLMAMEINKIYKTGCFSLKVDNYEFDPDTGLFDHTKSWGK